MHLSQVEADPASLTPHADSVQGMRKHIREYYTPLTALPGLDGVTARMRLAFLETFLTAMPYERDIGTPHDDIAGAMVGAIASVCSAFATSRAMTDGDNTNEGKVAVLKSFLQQTANAALQTMLDDDGSVAVQVTSRETHRT